MAATAPSAVYGSLPFSEQIKFFRGKLDLKTESWTDIWQAEHDHAFVVAGANRDDLVADFRRAVDKAVAQGGTLQEFRADFEQIVSTYGWQYNGSPGWRSRVIYETNLRTSYAAGRYAQLEEAAATQPYWRYKHNDSVAHPRPMHLAWDGLILAQDDPWWETHAPPNGWGCKCYVEGVTRRDMRNLGKSGPDSAPPIDWETRQVGTQGPSPRTVQVPAGIDPGWGYAPGESWVRSLTPALLDEPFPSVAGAVSALTLPAARTVQADRLLPPDLPADTYIQRFLDEFGAAEGDRFAVFSDAIGEPLVISDRLFRDAAGEVKVMKRGRERYVLLFADAIRDPAEIWVGWSELPGGRKVIRRRYVDRFLVEGSEVPALAVFETGPQGWIGVTAFNPQDVETLERSARVGKRLYRRKE